MTPAADKIREWRHDGVQFVRDVFNTELDSWQREAMDAFVSQDPAKNRISLQACVGPGKSAMLAMCGWHFLLCQGDKNEHPKGACVSVSSDNLKDNLWAEYSKWQEKSPLLMRLFTWTKERIFAKDHPPTWFMSARSYSKTANAEEQGRTLSGLHSKYVLAQIDESGDISPAVAKAAEQALSTNPVFGKIIQAGNPTSLSGILYAAATSLRHLWYVIVITGDPEDERRSPRIGIEWAQQQIDTYGRDNPWIMSSILGKFPPASINTLIGPDEVMAAMQRRAEGDAVSSAQKRLGVDVARFGDDRTVIFPRQGLMAFKPVEMRGARSNDIAARVMKAKMKWESEIEFVDGTGGWGSGVIDSLIQGGYAPVEVQFAGKAIDSRYYNKRAEMWFDMSEWIKRGGSLPNIPQLQRELTAPTYTMKNGKFMLEPKEQVKARLGFSPDLADALGLTFALPEMPGRNASPLLLRNQGKMLSDYDPMDESR